MQCIGWLSIAVRGSALQSKVNNMNRILRALCWLKDSLPIYSRRDLARHWFSGQDFAIAQLGIKRGAHGHFVSAKTPSPSRMVAASKGAFIRTAANKRSESSDQGDLFLTA